MITGVSRSSVNFELPGNCIFIGFDGSSLRELEAGLCMAEAMVLATWPGTVNLCTVESFACIGLIVGLASQDVDVTLSHDSALGNSLRSGFPGGVTAQ